MMLHPGPTVRDHAVGPRDAALVVVEYGDFECPFCGRAYPVLERLRQVDSVRLVYRHFPLTQVHPHALVAAEAAEAAGRQGQFWAMHDLLYQNQDALELADLLRYADLLELDLHSFADALARHAHLPRIREDFQGGVRSGVNGTPTLFLNGMRYDGVVELGSILATAAQQGVPTIDAP
jgi:protein-disulfide isomerase